MNNIIIITWTHQFGAVEAPAEFIAEGLRQNGDFVTIVNISTQQGQSSLIQSITSKIDLVLGMNPHVFLHTINGKLLHQFIQSRFAILLFSYFIYLI